MRAHIIIDGVVANTLMASVEEATSAYPTATCIDGSIGGIGWTWDGTTLTAPEVPPPTPAELREAAKAQRTEQVSAIKVTTAAGNQFDGDEVSQGRMARAIIALSTGLAPSVSWVLADNTVIQATPQELTEALVLAGMAQAAIWVI